MGAACGRGARRRGAAPSPLFPRGRVIPAKAGTYWEGRLPPRKREPTRSPDYGYGIPAYAGMTVKGALGRRMDSCLRRNDATRPVRRTLRPVSPIPPGSRHSRESGNLPPLPSSPRKRESRPLRQTPLARTPPPCATMDPVAQATEREEDETGERGASFCIIPASNSPKPAPKPTHWRLTANPALGVNESK